MFVKRERERRRTIQAKEQFSEKIIDVASEKNDFCAHAYLQVRTTEHFWIFGFPSEPVSQSTKLGYFESNFEFESQIF